MMQTNTIRTAASKNVIHRIYRTCTSFDLKIKYRRNIYTHTFVPNWMGQLQQLLKIKQKKKKRNNNPDRRLRITTTIRQNENVVILQLTNIVINMIFTQKIFHWKTLKRNTTKKVEEKIKTIKDDENCSPFFPFGYIILFHILNNRAYSANTLQSREKQTSLIFFFDNVFWLLLLPLFRSLTLHFRK